jgi:23S rRNA (adenine-N6)-dimethyltransferase
MVSAWRWSWCVVSVDKRTRWNWHQLTDDWARVLVEDAAIRRGDLVLDVGAGRGALTVPLVAAGARVIAVELNPARIKELRSRFQGPPVTVVHADATDLRLPRSPFHVVANPPFAISAALIRRLVAPGSRLVTATVVVPRYMAERWASQRHYGAARWATTFDVAVGRVLPRRAFRPAPPGQTAVLRIVRRSAAWTPPRTARSR